MELERFIAAQAPVYDQALAELKAGRKRSHWMWFVFPQIAGLGHSAMAQKYAIESLDEAQNYLEHPILGSRLRACTQAVLALKDSDAHAVFGAPDDLKFRSAMTLFDLASPDDIFGAALKKYFGGEADALTVEKVSDGL